MSWSLKSRIEPTTEPRTMQLTDEQALELIRAALEKTKPGLGAKADVNTHLIKDKVIDSLDSMNFLFELEELHGAQLDAIDETFDDFRVSRLIEILKAA
jgi:acyl carrier protein